MFDNIYLTDGFYVYNIQTCRLFRVSPDAKRVLARYSGAEALRNAQPEMFETFKPLLEKINLPRESLCMVDDERLSTLQLIVCNSCNMACKYCYAHAGTYKRPQETMSFETARIAIDLMFSKYARIKSIVFFGGEPLLCMELLEEVCRYLSERYTGRYDGIGMMSNLYSLPNRAIELIQKYNIGVSTSLDGTETLNAYRVTRKGESSYRDVVDNIKRLYAAAGQPSSIEVTMSNLHSDRQYTKNAVIRELASLLPVKNYTVNTVTDFEGSMEEMLYQKSASPISLDIECFLETGIYNMQINDLAAVMTGKNTFKRFCNAGESQYCILPNGDIYPCHLYSLDPSRRFYMGNVHSFSAAEFETKRREAIAFNRKDTYAQCEGCPAKSVCTSCLGSNLSTGAPIPHDAQFCQEKRAYFFSLIEVYAELAGDPERLARFKERLKEANLPCSSN